MEDIIRKEGKAMRAIYLPAIEKHVSLSQYIKGVKLAKNNLEMEFKHGLTCWWPCTGKDIVRQFREGMNERINQGIPYIKRK